MYRRALDIAIHAASNAAHQIVSKTPSLGVAAAGTTGERNILAIDAGTGDAIRDYLSNAFPAWGIVGTPDTTTSRFDLQQNRMSDMSGSSTPFPPPWALPTD